MSQTLIDVVLLFYIQHEPSVIIISYISYFCVIGLEWKNKPSLTRCETAPSLFLSTLPKRTSLFRPVYVCVFFVRRCYSSCLSHRSLDHLPDSGFIWAPEFTWGCGVDLRLLALHCGNIVIALRDHSCHLGPDLNWLQSEGVEAAVRLNHESAAAFLFSPQSLNQQNLCSVKTFVPFGSKQSQSGLGARPGGGGGAGGWGGARVQCVPRSHSTYKKTTNIICDLYKFQNVHLHLNSGNFQMVQNVLTIRLFLPREFLPSFTPPLFLTHAGVQRTVSTLQQTTTDHAVSKCVYIVTHIHLTKQ